MATRSQQVARLVEQGEPPVVARRRAPKRAGHRAQLTVPEPLWAAARELAEEIGTTPNDVIVRLASQQLEAAQRRAELERIATERWHAFRQAAPEADPAETPALEELLDAAAALRVDSTDS
jgi:hypothetical protein